MLNVAGVVVEARLHRRLIEQLKEILALRDRGEVSWHYVTELLERRQHDLVRHLAELEQLNAQLAKLVGIAATGTASHSPAATAKSSREWIHSSNA